MAILDRILQRDEASLRAKLFELVDIPGNISLAYHNIFNADMNFHFYRKHLFMWQLHISAILSSRQKFHSRHPSAVLRETIIVCINNIRHDFEVTTWRQIDDVVAGTGRCNFIMDRNRILKTCKFKLTSCDILTFTDHVFILSVFRTI